MTARLVPRLRRCASLLGLAALLSLGGVTCGTSLVHIPIAGLGQSGDAAIALKGGARVSFALYVDSYSYSGADDVMVDVEFRKGGKTVGKFTCAVFDFEGGSGGGCGGAKQYNSDCDTTVPTPGTDALHVKVYLKVPGDDVSMKGIELDVRQP